MRAVTTVFMSMCSPPRAITDQAALYRGQLTRSTCCAWDSDVTVRVTVEPVIRVNDQDGEFVVGLERTPRHNRSVMISESDCTRESTGFRCLMCGNFEKIL